MLVEYKDYFIGLLNLRLDAAKGKYIASMDTDDIMYPDRLKIQHAIMETEPNITVSSKWMRQFGENVPLDNIAGSLSEIAEYPLLAFLQGNFVFHPTTLIWKSFLKEHQLQYKNYPYTEDLRLWTEIAKLGGLFYVENQPLFFYRISKGQVTQQEWEELKATAEQKQLEIVNYHLDKIEIKYPEFTECYTSKRRLQKNELLSFRIHWK